MIFLLTLRSRNLSYIPRDKETSGNSRLGWALSVEGSQIQALLPLGPLFTWWWVAFAVIEMNSNSGHSSLSAFRLISLKVLNSIVLLGKSCQYVKEARMEEKLFNPPPTSTPSKPSSKSQSKCKPSQGRSGSSCRFSAFPEVLCLHSPW